MDRVKSLIFLNSGLLLLGVGNPVSGAFKFSPRVYIAPEWPILGEKEDSSICQTCNHCSFLFISEWHSEKAQTCEE